MDTPPAIKAWHRADLASIWTPPTCTGWTKPGFTTLVATAALFHHGSGVEGLLQRIGAISQLAGVRYWPVTHKRWQTLVVNAYALSGSAGQRRKDFLPEEMTAGKYLYFQ